MLAQHGGTANYGLNRVSTIHRVTAGEYYGASLYTTGSARLDGPTLGIRTHLSINRLSD
jgi:hypothetical protein